jgi:molybdopterin/thiamine biosynthesis adenylyltransferase
VFDSLNRQLVYNRNACAVQQRAAVAARLQAVSNEGVQVHFHTFFTSASDAGNWPVSRIGLFATAENFHSAHLVWVGVV